MKTSTSISIDSQILAAAKRWSVEEHRPLSHQIEMILVRALAARVEPKAEWRESLEHSLAHLVPEGSSRAVCGAVGVTWTTARTHEKTCTVCKRGNGRKWPNQDQKGGVS